jgi:hypothetical protein
MSFAPVGHDRSVVVHGVDPASVDGEYTAADHVRRTRRNACVAVHGVRLEPRHHQPSARIAGAAHEDAAAEHRLADGARGEPGEIRSDHHVLVVLHVPQRESALHHAHAVTVRALGTLAGVGRDHVQAVDFDMTCANPVTGEDLHLTAGAHVHEAQRAEAREARVVEHRTPLRRGVEPQPADFVVGGEFEAVAVRLEDEARPEVVRDQRLSRREAKRRHLRESSVDGDPPLPCVTKRGEQLLRRVHDVCVVFH